MVGRSECIQAVAPHFVIAGIASFVVLGCYLKRRQSLNWWQLLLVLTGLKRVERTFVVNSAHFAALLLPFLVLLLGRQCFLK